MDNEISKTFQNKIESDISESEKRLMELINGAEPIDEDEIEMINEIKEAEKNNQIISIPSN